MLIFPIRKNFFVSFFFFTYHGTNSNLRNSHAAKNKLFSRYYSCNVGNFRCLYVSDVKSSTEMERSCVKQSLQANIAIAFQMHGVVAVITEIEKDIVK